MDSRVYAVHDRWPQYSRETLAQMLYLIESGARYSAICEQLNVSYDTVKNFRKRFGLPPHVGMVNRTRKIRESILTTRVDFKLTPEMTQKLKRRAMAKGMFVSAYVRSVVLADLR